MNGTGQAPHPTVGNLGMPPQVQGIGAPQYYGQPAPVNGMNPQTFQPYQQQPAQMFIPQPGMQPQYQQQAPQMQPQQQQWQGTPLPGPQMQPQPQFQQPQQPRLSVNGQEILDGPGVPLELRGRTMGQAMQLYTQLADHYIRNSRSQPQQQGQQQLGQQPQFQQQPQTQQQAQQQPTQFQQGIAQAVQGAVQQAIEPIQEYTLRNAIRDAQQQAAQSIPDFAQLQEHIAPIVQGADPRNLANPQFWEGAADLARGRYAKQQMQMRQQPGGYPQQQYGSAPQAWQPQPAQQFFGQNGQYRAAPAGNGFPQPTYQFFTEGPTPPGAGPQNYGEFTPVEIGMMQATGMTPEAYRAWKGGTQPARRW